MHHREATNPACIIISSNLMIVPGPGRCLIDCCKAGMPFSEKAELMRPLKLQDATADSGVAFNVRQRKVVHGYNHEQAAINGLVGRLASGLRSSIWV
jgi:hypothetical protein